MAPRPQRGGHALTTGPITQTLAQSDNPSQPSRQDQDTIRTRTYTLPPGTRIEQSSGIAPIPSYSPHESHSGASITPSLQYSNAPSVITLSAPMPVVDRTESHASTELGAAQKDTARELAAKLSSLKSITWLGAAIFILGLASLFWPPLQTVIGSVTTSTAITLGGLALIILPTLIVGNELLILGGVTLSVGAWFLAHRHGHLKGQLAATPPKIINHKS